MPLCARSLHTNNKWNILTTKSAILGNKSTCLKQSNHNHAKSTKITMKKETWENNNSNHVWGETQYENYNSNVDNHAMATVRTSEQAKANEKVFCCCLYATHTLSEKAPSPLTHITQAARPDWGRRRKTNNKIKPLSIASQLRYECVCVCGVCAVYDGGGGGGKCEIEKRRWSIASNPAKRQQQQQQQPRWDDIRVYRHRKLVCSVSSDSGWGQGGWQRTGRHTYARAHTHTLPHIGLYVCMSVSNNGRESKSKYNTHARQLCSLVASFFFLFVVYIFSFVRTHPQSAYNKT